MARTAKKSSTPKSTKAGLIMPIAKIGTHLKKTFRPKRVSEKAPLYVAAAVQMILESALVCAFKQVPAGKNRITRMALLKALRSDKDLNRVFAGYTASSTDALKVAPSSLVSPVVLNYRAEKKKQAAEAASA